MKKLSLLVLSLVLILSTLAFASCNKPKTYVVTDGDYVVITVDKKNVSENASLLDYMNYLKDNGEFSFEINNGMVTSINNLKGENGKYWMLYTDDIENSNEQCGIATCKDKTYNSATLGVTDLKIKDECVYIWYLQSFN